MITKEEYKKWDSLDQMNFSDEIKFLSEECYNWREDGFKEDKVWVNGVFGILDEESLEWAHKHNIKLMEYLGVKNFKIVDGHYLDEAGDRVYQCGYEFSLKEIYSNMEHLMKLTGWWMEEYPEYNIRPVDESTFKHLEGK